MQAGSVYMLPNYPITVFLNIYEIGSSVGDIWELLSALNTNRHKKTPYLEREEFS